MLRYVLVAGVMGLTATQAPLFFEKMMEAREDSRGLEGNQHGNADIRTVSLKSRQKHSEKISVSGRKVRIKAGQGGHYYTDVRMNNRTVKVLVDTGATMVAINETTARKIGIRLKSSDFKYKVNTANGVTMMAAATIKEIRIGNIRVENVRAGVSRDSALSTTLLGMSFLNQLKRFGVSNQTLLLEQ